MVYINQTKCFVLGDAADLDKLQQVKVPVAVLERNPAIQDNNSYFAVYPDQELCPIIKAEEFILCGKVLDAVDNILIIKGTPENIRYFAPVPVELVSITSDPVEIPEKISRTIIRENILSVG